MHTLISKRGHSDIAHEMELWNPSFLSSASRSLHFISPISIFSHSYTWQDWTRQHQPLSIALRESESIFVWERGWWWPIDPKIAAGDLMARVTLATGLALPIDPAWQGGSRDRIGHVEQSYGNGCKLLPACPCLCGLTRDQLCFKPIT